MNYAAVGATGSSSVIYLATLLVRLVVLLLLLWLSLLLLKLLRLLLILAAALSFLVAVDADTSFWLWESGFIARRQTEYRF